MKQEANDAPGNATTTDEQNVTERQDPQRDIEEGLPGGQVHDLGDDHRHSTRRQEENNARRKNKNLAEDMYRRLTPTLFVTSSAADADLALDWVFAVELLRRSRTDIDYKFFVLSAIFSSIGSLLWVLCTFDISGFSGPRPPNVPESEWTRPEHHPFWWMLPKGFLVFVTVLLEDIPQLVITSVVQRKYDPSNLTSFALANIVTSLYAMGLKLVQTFMEQSTYELDIPTTINLANAFEENNEFGLLLEARQSAEKLIEKSMYAFAYGRVTVRTDDPAWETLLLAFSSDAVSHFRVLGHLSAQKGKALARAIEPREKNCSLDLSNTRAEPGAIHALAAALEKNSSLVKLRFDGSSIGDEGAKTLAAALKKNNTLRELHLNGSSIGDEGATALADALKNNNTLWSLYLNGNSIGDEGATDLAAALKKNNTLIRLYLDGNSISDDGAAALAAALEKNNTLWSLYLNGNSISDTGATELAAALEENNTLRTLYLNGNSISDDGAKALAAALEKNSILTWLDLSGNSISDDGIKALQGKLCRVIC